jgi:leader peptidase (prepilin peptidase) / N-methyltransferase
VTLQKGREDLEEFSIKSFLIDKRVLILQFVLTLFLYNKFGFSVNFIIWTILLYILVVLSIIDYKFKAVPDYLLLLLLVISPFVSDSFIDFIRNGFIFAGGFVILNFFVTYYIQNIKSRILKDDTLKEQTALGEGDIPLLAFIGGILGIKLGLLAIMIASLVALIHGIYNASKKIPDTPFIPYLSIGFITVYLMQETIYNTFSNWILQ